MIRSILFLHAKGDNYDSVVDYFEHAGVLERASQKLGCHGAEIQIPMDGSGPVVVTALWDSATAYQGWLDDPWRAESNAALGELLDDSLGHELRASLYKVSHSATSSAD